MDFITDILFYFILLLGGYLLGSFSSAYWYVKWFYNKDIRKTGSNNAGATNVFRTLGLKAGLPVFITDVGKAYLSTQLVHLSDNLAGTTPYTLLMIGLGVAVITGHILPAFSQFKGGKGVACTFGVILAINPMGSLMALGIFIIILLISRIVSLSSLIAATSYAIMVSVKFFYDDLLLVIFCWVIPIILFVTHRENIKKIFKGEEKKIFNYRKNNLG